MKRYTWIFLAVLTVIALSVSLSQAAFGPRDVNSFYGQLRPLDITLPVATRGVVFHTAAINPDGTIASCFGCVPPQTLHLSTGNYQIGFNEGSVQAAKGWSRWLQVDTLTINSILGVSCTTADRAGVAAAVFVHCENHTGPVDTSFFLFVAR